MENYTSSALQSPVLPGLASWSDNFTLEKGDHIVTDDTNVNPWCEDLLVFNSSHASLVGFFIILLLLMVTYRLCTWLLFSCCSQEQGPLQIWNAYKWLGCYCISGTMTEVIQVCNNSDVVRIYTYTQVTTSHNRTETRYITYGSSKWQV